jgi:hypothetical protein
MAAEFVKVFTMQGFDRQATPRWQMVPVNGDRYVALRSGAGLVVTSNNPGVVRATEIALGAVPGGERQPLHSGDRVFKLHGVTKGNARLQAKNAGGVTAVELEVDTKDKKTVGVTFNFVRDSGGHHTVRPTASAAHWVSTMRYVYSGQANIEPTLRHTRQVRVPVDLGPQVMWTSGADSEWDTVTALGDAAADMNYFLVWEYEQDATPTVDNTDAGTMAANCIFEDAAGSAVGVTMAHEMGHYLGVDDHYDVTHKLDLMYGITDQRGINLRKSDVNTMNP